MHGALHGGMCPPINIALASTNTIRGVSRNNIISIPIDRHTLGLIPPPPPPPNYIPSSREKIVPTPILCYMCWLQTYRFPSVYFTYFIIYRLDLVDSLVISYGHILSDQSEHLFLDTQYLFFLCESQSVYIGCYLEFALTGN